MPTLIAMEKGERVRRKDGRLSPFPFSPVPDSLLLLAREREIQGRREIEKQSKLHGQFNYGATRPFLMLRCHAS